MHDAQGANVRCVKWVESLGVGVHFPRQTISCIFGRSPRAKIASGQLLRGVLTHLIRRIWLVITRLNHLIGPLHLINDWECKRYLVTFATDLLKQSHDLFDAVACFGSPQTCGSLAAPC